MKERIFGILRSPEFENELEALDEFLVSKIVRQLLSALCSEDEEIKWHAVTAMGIAMARLAHRDLESARKTLRRLIWLLNEESGGIGWGIPEALGEILARHPALAREYTPILLSYIQPGENFLEFGPLQRGALWAVGRLAEAHPKMLSSLRPGRYLQAYLHSPDPLVRGHALWAGVRVGIEGDLARIEELLEEEGEIRIYEDQKFRSVSIRELARGVLEKWGKNKKGAREHGPKMESPTLRGN